MNTYQRVIVSVAIVSTAMAGGAFFPFSTFAIRGLKRLPPSDGAAAMQEVNKAAPSPLFMLLLFGTGVNCVLVGVHAVQSLEGQIRALRVAAAGLYVFGVVLLTIGYHVPRNSRLARLNPRSESGVRYWDVYLSEWVSRNHVRTVAPLISSVLFLLSLELA